MSHQAMCDLTKEIFKMSGKTCVTIHFQIITGQMSCKFRKVWRCSLTIPNHFVVNADHQSLAIHECPFFYWTTA